MNRKVSTDEFLEQVNVSWAMPVDFVDDYISEIYELFETGSVTIKLNKKEYVLNLSITTE